MKITTIDGEVKNVGQNFLKEHYQGVKNYHNSQNRTRPYKLGIFNGVGLGLEIEMGNDNFSKIAETLGCDDDYDYDDDYDCMEDAMNEYNSRATHELNKVVGGLVNYEHDCSVRYGCEMITRTMTKDFFDKEFPWEKFEPIANKWYDNGQDSCGLHLHISGNLLGPIGSASRSRALQKLLVFTTYFATELTQISGRNDYDQLDEYASFSNYRLEEIDDMDIKDIKREAYRTLINSGDRYKALNLCNLKRNVNSSGIDTIEYRFFASTFTAKRIRAIVDFLWTITKNAKTIPWKKVMDFNCWMKGIKKETLDTLGL